METSSGLSSAPASILSTSRPWAPSIYRLLRVSHDRPATGDSFEASGLAAAADNVLIDDARVADVPRRAACASVDPAFREQSGTKSGTDLAVDQVDRRLMTRAFADREQVHVLVDPGRDVELLLEPSADVVAVPSRHHRGGDRPTGLESHGPWYTDRDRPQRRILDLPQHLGDHLEGCGKRQLRPAGDVPFAMHVRKHIALKGSDSDMDMQRAQGTGDQEPALGPESQAPRRATGCR